MTATTASGALEKEFDGFLVLNWKNGKIEVKKRKPKNLTPFEILINLKIKVKVPEQKELVASGTVVLSESKIKEMVIEEF